MAKAQVNTQHRTVGDTLSPLSHVLVDADQNPVDLTGATVTFLMIDATSKAVKVEAAADIVDAPAGEVQYEFADPDVDTAGTFSYWFIVEVGGKFDHHPANGETHQIILAPSYYPAP